MLRHDRGPNAEIVKIFENKTLPEVERDCEEGLSA